MRVMIHIDGEPAEGKTRLVNRIATLLAEDTELPVQIVKLDFLETASGEREVHLFDIKLKKS